MSATTIHVGVSELRKFNSYRLDTLNTRKQVAVIHDHAQPIAVLVGFDLYMALQAAVREKEGREGIGR